MFGMTADQIAFWTLVAAVVAIFVGVWAAVEARRAAKYGKDAPTKDDLARVERNTAHLEEVKASIARMDDRLHRQSFRESLIAEAQRISLSAKGESAFEEPMTVRLTLHDPSIILTHLELFNEVGTRFGGTYECKAVEPLIYDAVLDALSIRQWFSGGRAVESSNRRLLNLKVFTVLSGEKVYRPLPVEIVIGYSMNRNLYVLSGNV